jgi:hypothetical protein
MGRRSQEIVVIYYRIHFKQELLKLKRLKKLVVGKKLYSSEGCLLEFNDERKEDGLDLYDKVGLLQRHSFLLNCVTST